MFASIIYRVKVDSMIFSTDALRTSLMNVANYSGCKLIISFCDEGEIKTIRLSIDFGKRSFGFVFFELSSWTIEEANGITEIVSYNFQSTG